ncbi:MAG: DUF1002 domain-containing protein, partial [Eubacterium sp.]|nr:DUF1002 domain-containing protein [Eubacterium sp.]
MSKAGLLKLTATSMAALMMAMTLLPANLFADSVEKTYLSLGADLNKEEKATVLNLLGIEEDQLDDYELVTVTNAEEHDYLDDYLNASIIGSRALSSVLIEKKAEGNGIHVTTKNITYCTEGMYQNALTTAGITDADITVAGPFNLTGTAALVGAMKAYEDMTGKEIEASVKDTATNELILTGNLAEQIGGNEQAEELIAMLKEFIAKHENPTEKEIEEAIAEGEEKLDITLT